ncbi:nuclear transport factor 2 family protein [Proteobacteria bacterium 005FR1]|nr:nuclear transport factor 2 family protein [Proteobacteria bacterium 005FR1]
MNVIDQWHRLATDMDKDALWNLLAEDAAFHSPVVHTPQAGRPLVHGYLMAASAVLGNESFRYVREVVSGNNAVLEFTADIDGISINGVDMIHWNAENKIDDFKVMIRPLKAINLIHQKMAEMLAAQQTASR